MYCAQFLYENFPILKENWTKWEKKKPKPKNLNFKCGYCRKKFSTKFQKTVHEVVHTGKRDFVCEICEKSFTQKSNLKTRLFRLIPNAKIQNSSK